MGNLCFVWEISSPLDSLDPSGKTRNAIHVLRPVLSSSGRAAFRTVEFDSKKVLLIFLISDSRLNIFQPKNVTQYFFQKLFFSTASNAPRRDVLKTGLKTSIPFLDFSGASET